MGREIRFRDRNAAAVHDAIPDLRPVRVCCPSLPWYNISVCVQGTVGPGAEAVADDQVLVALIIPFCFDQFIRNRVPLHVEAEPLKETRGDLRVVFAVTPGIVRRDLDELSKEVDLLRVQLINNGLNSGDRCCSIHVGFPVYCQCSVPSHKRSVSGIEDAQKFQEDAHGNVCVLRRDCFGRTVADPASTPHEQHPHGAEAAEDHSVVASSGWDL